VSRNGSLHEIQFKSGKLYCDCSDSTFLGVPCRHLIALVTKEENLSFNHLPINSRWRIDFFIDNLEPEPILLDSIKQIEEITDKFQVSN